MVDIHSATAEIRRGKKEERKKQDKNVMSSSATQGGHNNHELNEYKIRIRMLFPVCGILIGFCVFVCMSVTVLFCIIRVTGYPFMRRGIS